jgi:hypothetical protein
MMMYELSDLKPEHARVIIKALELYTRLSLGQLEYVGEVVAEMHPEPHGFDASKMTAHDMISLFRMMKEPIIGIASNGGLGIGHDKQSLNGKLAYEIECTLRREVAKAEKHGDHSVWHRKPLSYTDVAMPVAWAHE